MLSRMCVVNLIVLLFLTIKTIVGYNLSPFPSLVFTEPNLFTQQPKVETSYFGYTINLRDKSIIIGAPRAQSTLRNINETGELYRCTYDNPKCAPFIVDIDGEIETFKGGSYYYKFQKSHQFLGAAMDGHSSDSDNLVVCAPSIVTTDDPEHHLYHGVCFMCENTETNKPSVIKWDDLRMISRQTQFLNGSHSYWYMYGQLGFSVHATDNKEQFLVGAPGILNWKGSVARYRPRESVKLPGMSKRDTSAHEAINYESNIPNPIYWPQDNNSYFGFAVGSGDFRASTSEKIPKLLYVASAPQGKEQSGEVFIYDYALQQEVIDNWKIVVYKKFYGIQIGEYFGYSLLVDDFNGDNVMDIVISAPYFSRPSISGVISNSYDNGKVYVYLNQGDLTFRESEPLFSNYDAEGRYGLTLGRIHDINNDGYNDIAVAAPFEGNGVVYIHLGGRNGISPTPSQKLVAPQNTNYPTPNSHIFGYGMSKGVDMDGNGFNDLAIGSPNTDTVYVYKSYPTIQIISIIESFTPIISMNETSVQIRSCHMYRSPVSIPFEVKAIITIKLDPTRKRAKFDSGENELTETVTLGNSVCTTHNIQLTYTIGDIFNPIMLEQHHQLVKKFDEYTEFCTDCVALNPNDPKFTRNQIGFSTGCKETRCLSDLNVKSTVKATSLPFVLGSSNSILIEYIVENLAESAYTVTINIQIQPITVTFYKIPSNCELNEKGLDCDLVRGRPLNTGESTRFEITLDVSRLEGTELIVIANTTSTGDEVNPDDNVVTDSIPLIEYSDIEVVGKSSLPISVEEAGLIEYNIRQRFEIKNDGPSFIKHLTFTVHIPLIFISSYPLAKMHLVDPKSVKISGEYDNSVLGWRWNHKNITNDDDPTAADSIIIVDSMNGLAFDSSKQGMDYEMAVSGASPDGFLNEGEDGTLVNFNQRGRRDLSFHTYNRYTQQLVEHHNVSRRKRSVTQKFDTAYENLPQNRLIYFNCSLDEDTEHFCVSATFDIKNFKSGDKRAVIDLSFNIDLSKVDELYTDLRDIFVLVSRSTVAKPDDDSGATINVITYDPYSVITKYLKQETPIWIIIVSTIVGILILILLVYVLYRCGFFRRSQKEEMEQQKKTDRQSQLQSFNENETDDDL